MQIHDRLLRWNRSAAQRLFKDLDVCLTLHQTGLYEQLSRSLCTTHCVTHTVQYINQRLRDIRHWLPPQSHRAQLALLLLERESKMHRLAHASYLSSMQTSLFPST